MADVTHGPVAVVGLGSMGTALARALLAAGVPTTVWNRSPERAESLRGEGATVAATLGEAVASGDLLVVCLRDHEAAREVLDELAPAAYAGHTVVNLSSSTPGEGRRTAARAAERGITYLTGAIMVPTPLIGGPDALILYSGERAVFDRHVETLRVLAGVADHLGEDPGQAAMYDVAMLEIFFAGMTSFLHAAAMVTAQGVQAKAFLPYAQQIVSLLTETLSGLAADVDTGTYSGAEDNLAMELAALEHIADTSAEVGLDSRLPALMRDLARQAVDAGHGTDGYSRLVDILRPA
jgi:3-hydroxyisobutyrate dehydrogenase-like beta-hydroxyacid dehydrogenase